MKIQEHKNIRTKERIIGIDPGFGRMGFGVIEGQGSTWTAIAYGCVETPKTDTFVERLKYLAAALQKLIATYHPSRAAVEELFFYNNAKTAMQVGEARGAILMTLVAAGIPIDEFTPLQVKQAMTGYGRAEKGQVESMVQVLLGLKGKKIQDDAADALAVALTCGASLMMNERIQRS